jgi:hypothetical protein
MAIIAMNGAKLEEPNSWQKMVFRESPVNAKDENRNEWWAWVDLNHRPRLIGIEVVGPGDPHRDR